ncbi:MAG TPA: M1 family aminopeptidase [Candidatus Eisenbacteria bacterium]|nr:M1 family aminopeptidase [Candidatus Eisenbacteria bacterium]
MHDPFFHPIFLGRRAALETPPFDPFPPSGRKPWTESPSPRRDLEFHVRHYKVELDVDFEKKELNGRCTLTIESLRDGLRDVVLDAAEMRIASVKIGRRSLAHASEGEKLRVALGEPLRAGSRVLIEIAYATRPRKGFFFVGPTEAEPNRLPSGWSQGQANDTHGWIPCLESTESRGTLEMIVTVPAGYRAIGNGRLVSRKSRRAAASARRNGRRRARSGRAKPGTVTYHWRQDTPHPVYLTSLVVGKYSELKDRAGSVPLFGYVPPGLEREGRDLFRKTPAMIATFQRVFGFPYPYPKYAQSTVADFTWGGMENTSATTLMERVLHAGNDSFEERYDSLIAHELAHQWWGDLVTCRDWSEGWLNEGFATYSEIVFRESDEGRDDADYARLEQMSSYLTEDGEDYRRPLVETRWNYPSSLFDRHLYEKGACVLHMLRALVGDAAWRRSLKRYLERHAFGSVETADLRRMFEEVTGRNLSWFFDQWVYHGGHPELRVTRSWDEGARTLLLTVEQVQEVDKVTPLFRIPLTLEVVSAGRRLRIPLDLTGKRETIHVPLPGRPRYVALDPEHDVLKTMDFARSDQELLFGLRRSPFALERIRCARELARRGDERVIGALLKTLRGDRFWGVRAAAAVSLGEIGRRVPGVSARIAREADQTSTRVRRGVLWGLGWVGDDAALKRLTRSVAEETSSFNIGLALIGIARAKREGAFEALKAELKRESHRDMLRVLIFDAMARLRDPRAIPILLEHTQPRFRNEAREAATKALGKLGVLNSDVERRLEELTQDSWFRVRSAAAGSLRRLKSPRAEAAIREALRTEPLDGVRSALEKALTDGHSG